MKLFYPPSSCRCPSCNSNFVCLPVGLRRVAIVSFALSLDVRRVAVFTFHLTVDVRRVAVVSPVISLWCPSCSCFNHRSPVGCPSCNSCTLRPPVVVCCVAVVLPPSSGDPHIHVGKMRFINTGCNSKIVHLLD